MYRILLCPSFDPTTMAELYQLAISLPVQLATFIARALSYTPEPQAAYLPIELILMIVSHLTSTRDLSSVARTSRAFYILAMPLLYDRAVLTTRPSTPTHFQWHPTPNRTILHFAAAHGNIALLNALISRLGPHVHVLDDRDSYGHTPLISATLHNHRKVVHILIDAGANIERTTTKYNWSPLHIAAAMGNVDIARILVDAGANRELRDTVGLTPIHVLSLTRYGTELCPVFEEMGFDGRALDRDGLGVASKCSVIRCLLDHLLTHFPLPVDQALSRSTGVELERLDSIVRFEEGLRIRCMMMLGYEMDRCLMCVRSGGASVILTDTANIWYLPGMPHRHRGVRQWQFWWRRGIPDENSMAKELEWQGRPQN